MTAHQLPPALLTLPAKTRTRLSLVGHRKHELQTWLDNLPLMNAAASGKQLHQTLRELTELDIPAEQRFEILEVLEPALHTLTDVLAKHSHTQAVLASALAQRVAAFTQNLHGQLALNYKIVAVETLHKLEGRVGLFDLGRQPARQHAALALQRAIHQLCCLLLDAALTYSPPPSFIWADLHGLFREAQRQGLLDLPVHDRYCHLQQQTTIRRSYLRAVFLAAGQLQKLHQTDILLLYTRSEDWADLLTVNDQPTGSLLVCNPGEYPPACHHRLPATPDSWYIHCRELVSRLQTCREHSAEDLPPGLVVHLLEVWGHNRERMFERRPCDQPLALCLGLSASHYFMSGEQDFARVVAAAPLSQEVTQPAFLFALEEDQVATEHADTPRVQGPGQDHHHTPRPYPVYTVQAVNYSPAGYGVCWPEQPPAELRPGELIGIYPEHGQGWLIGLMHWTRHTPDATEAGLEVLSTHAKPCAVCLCDRKRNKSQYLRSMLIPAMPSLERPATLLTPTSFNTGDNIRICLHGNTIQARLTHLILATPGIRQFEFAWLNQHSALPAPTESEDKALEELWAKL